jgi:hypothetical protein
MDKELDDRTHESDGITETGDKIKILLRNALNTFIGKGFSDNAKNSLVRKKESFVE